MIHSLPPPFCLCASQFLPLALRLHMRKTPPSCHPDHSTPSLQFLLCAYHDFCFCARMCVGVPPVPLGGIPAVYFMTLRMPFAGTRIEIVSDPCCSDPRTGAPTRSRPPDGGLRSWKYLGIVSQCAMDSLSCGGLQWIDTLLFPFFAWNEQDIALLPGDPEHSVPVCIPCKNFCMSPSLIDYGVALFLFIRHTSTNNAGSQSTDLVIASVEPLSWIFHRTVLLCCATRAFSAS
mgnify:CR=1 FL=1